MTAAAVAASAAAAGAVGHTLHGDDDGSISHDSLESILECGWQVARATGEINPEAYRLAHWWDQEGAGAFAQAEFFGK